MLKNTVIDKQKKMNQKAVVNEDTEKLANAMYVFGPSRHYVFDLLACLCMRRHMPGKGIFQPAFRRLLVSFSDLHRESKKTRHQTLGHNFTNYYPIFNFFSLADSVVNLQQIHV